MNASLASRAPRALLAAASIALVTAGCTGEDTQGVHHTFAEAQAIVDGLALEITSPTADHVFADGATIAVAGGVGVAGAWPEGLSFTVELRDGGTALRTRAVAMSAQAPTFDETFEGPAPGWYDAALIATLVGEAPGGALKTARAEVAARFAVNAPAPAPTVTIRATADGVAVAPGVELTAEAEVEDDTIAPEASLQLEYRWFRDGEAAAIRTRVDDPTLPGALVAAGATLKVEVRANDGFREGFDGAPAGEASVTIPNAAATCGAMLVSPAAADTTRDITCRCTDFDSPIDGGDRSTCVFRDGDGEVLQDDGSCTLPAEKTEKGMTVTCELTPKDDGGVAGTTMTSAAPVTVLDAPPSAPEVAITPSAATAEDSVTCEVVTHGVDPDGDSVTYEVRWKVNGETVAGVATASTAVSALGATGGDEVVCEVKAVAGGASSAFAASAALTLGNATPQLPNVLLTSAPGSPPTVEDTLTCDASQATDADDASGESLTITYAWFIDDELVVGAEGATLSGDAFARGDVVKCRATACDAQGACTAAVNSKTSALVQNAPPSIGAVVITGGRAGGVGEPGDTLTCEFSGWQDADGDEPEVSYTWSVTDPDTGVTTVIVGQTSEDYIVSEALAEGAIVTCTVTPKNGDDAGAPRTADGGVTIVAPSPIAPVVSVVAPDGADGEVTCAVVEDAQNLPAGATWTWRWSLSGAAAFTGEATLAADAVSHCDLVKCWAELSGPGDLALTSNQAQLLLPLGSDCDDGDPCSGAVCFAAGGCNLTAVSGPSCDNGDPCTSDDYCSEGVCVAGPTVCTEDRVTVTPDMGTGGSVAPMVGALPGGGYVVHYSEVQNTPSSRRLMSARVTDGHGSRVAQKTHTVPLPTHFAPYNIASRPVFAGNGRYAVLTSDLISRPACNCACHNSNFRLRRFTLEGDPVDDVLAAVISQVNCMSYGRASNIRLDLAALSDDSYGVFEAYSYTTTIGQPGAPQAIRYRVVDATMQTGATVNLVAGGARSNTMAWEARVIPDGSDTILVAWAGSDGLTVFAQRFTKTGATVDSDPIAVATTTSAVTAVRAAGFVNGRFVVAWEADGLDGSGVGVRAQRFDGNANPLGVAIVATGATVGDQRLGGIGAFGTFGFVVAYRDTSDVTPAQRAQRFGPSGAALGAPIAINARATAGSRAAEVEVLDGDEWVVAWTDDADVTWTRRFTADGELAPRVAERRASTTYVGGQGESQAARAGDGDVMIVYSTSFYPGLGTEIAARVVDTEGVEVRGEQLVNTFLTGPQKEPTVAGGPDRFAVAWTSDDEDGSSVEGVIARLFDGAGAPLGEAFIVPEATASFQQQPSAAMTGTGAWMVAWNGYSAASGSLSDVYGRIFDASGAAVTGDLVINAHLGGPQERPAVAAIPFADAFIVAWQSRNQDGDGDGIYLRKVGADGEMLSPELRANTTTAGDQRRPAIAIAQDNRFAVCWTTPAGLLTELICQHFSTTTMAPQGAEVAIRTDLAGSRQDARVAFLPSGRLYVAYATEGLDHDGFAVEVTQLNNLGARVAPRFVSNRYWDGHQQAAWVVPADDRVLVGWTSDGQDGDGLGVYFRSFPLP